MPVHFKFQKEKYFSASTSDVGTSLEHQVYAEFHSL